MTAFQTLVLAFALMTLPCAAVAADSRSISNERRLAPEEIEKILSEAAGKREGAGTRTLPAEQAPDSLDTHVSGEVGLSIGSGGYRAAHGTAVIGLPRGGMGVISLGTRRLHGGTHWYPDR
ncbi:MAG TPA: hypothetical protein VGD23_00805 [Sphingomicrobium sp.]